VKRKVDRIFNTQSHALEINEVGRFGGDNLSVDDALRLDDVDEAIDILVCVQE
jgi:hypothetical protein